MSETLLTFPCDFVIKIFGVATEQFEPEITQLIKKHVPLPESAISSRLSKDKKYLALSITVHVTSKEELDRIYKDITANPFVLMTL